MLALYFRSATLLVLLIGTLGIATAAATIILVRFFMLNPSIVISWKALSGQAHAGATFRELTNANGAVKCSAFSPDG